MPQRVVEPPKWRDQEEGVIDTIDPVIDYDAEPFGSIPEPSIVEPVREIDRVTAYFDAIQDSEGVRNRMTADYRLRRCRCGHPRCDSTTRKSFAPGHDAKMIARLTTLVSVGALSPDDALAVVRAAGGTSALGAKLVRSLSKINTRRTDRTGYRWEWITDTVLARVYGYHQSAARETIVDRIQYLPIPPQDGDNAGPWVLNHQTDSLQDFGRCDGRFDTYEDAMAYVARRDGRI